MNQLELILENIRLNHINKLLMEAQTVDELYRGVQLINESMQLVAGNLMEEMAVHSENDLLNKQDIKLGGNERASSQDIITNRNNLAHKIKQERMDRDMKRGSIFSFDQQMANYADNNARFKSRLGAGYISLEIPGHKHRPRLVKSTMK